ncbi:hypothetical protein ACN47E_002198 [Coniothyrium glycines]
MVLFRLRHTFLACSWVINLHTLHATPVGPQQVLRNCETTTVAILGAGVAGISAAQALSNHSIKDFIIIEYNDEIGGRAKAASFGKNETNGGSYTVELGPNWVEGVGRADGPQNPIWTLTQKWEVQSTLTNRSSILTYNETGAVDLSELLAEYEEKSESLSGLAGKILQENSPDLSARAGLRLSGWQPGRNMGAQAVEWWYWDWESAQSPEASSLVFGVAESNLTFNYFGNISAFVTEQKGYDTFIKGEASTFLQPHDPRLLLNTIVSKLEYSDSGVTVHNQDESCIHAAYAICTFSLGVLQNQVVQFIPQLPEWKRTAISMFRMGTYTKIFMQFETQFWPKDVEFLLYADPTRRGHYPIWQSLSLDGFHPGSNILFATVVGDEAQRIERQTDEETQEEALAVLRKMFPAVEVPDPISFLYPRWTLEPWVFGSYSDWPLGASLEMHQNLRANLGRLWFAGEAMSTQYLGLMHGAWLEGNEVGEQIAMLASGACDGDVNRDCGKEIHYQLLHGTTPVERYNSTNGWSRSSF